MTENYDELVDRLTGDKPVQGVGQALHGAEAAAYGRKMLKDALGPEKYAELLARLEDTPPTLHYGATDKVALSSDAEKHVNRLG